MIINKTVENFLTESECSEIIKTYNGDNLSDATIANQELNHSKRKSKIDFVEIEDLSDRLHYYIKNEIVFKNSSIDKLRKFQFTKYEVGDFYNWHTDYGVNNPDRYISLVILLNDDFDGGELKYKDVNTGEEFLFKRGVGNLFIFSSFTSHMVTPVTRGERYSLVNWLGISQTNFSKTLL